MTVRQWSPPVSKTKCRKQLNVISWFGRRGGQTKKRLKEFFVFFLKYIPFFPGSVAWPKTVKNEEDSDVIRIMVHRSTKVV